jgi:hypothetical protein
MAFWIVIAGFNTGVILVGVVVGLQQLNRIAKSIEGLGNVKLQGTIVPRIRTPTQ